MELNLRERERWEKVALAASALVIGGHIVRYVYNKRDETPQGYVYLTDAGSVMVGIYKNAKETVIQQFSGVLSDGNFELETINLPEGEIEEFERVFTPDEQIEPDESVAA